MSLFTTNATYLAVRYASALATPEMRSGVSNFASANVSTATRVFTATSTKMFAATAMAATPMTASTALGHCCLNAQIYQRAERYGCEYFDKVACHRRTPLP
jgi:hypothetical protein